MKLSVFLPAYNEENILEKNVNLVYNILKSFKESFELVIVDDGSKDKTHNIGKKLSKKKDIRYLRFENGPSRRENLAEAFKKAKGNIIIFMDMDLATDLKHILELINYIKQGYDVAVGSRYKGISAKRELSRRFISVVYNLFMRLYFGSKINDHQCGFKAFKKKVILDMVKDMGYDKKFVRGWFWDVELLIRAQKKGYKVKEFPVEWKFGDASSFILKREFKMLPYVLRLKWRIK